MAAPLREKCRTARGRLIVLTIQPNIGAIILSVEHCGHQGPAVSHAESGPCSYPMTQAEPTQTIGGSGLNLSNFEETEALRRNEHWHTKNPRVGYASPLATLSYLNWETWSRGQKDGTGDS